jgi:hypothetical protein
MGPSLGPSHFVSKSSFRVLGDSHLWFVDVVYDTMHYAYVTFHVDLWVILKYSIIRYSRMHHTKLPAYLREQKKYHLAHHYKNFELGFGVTSMTLFVFSKSLYLL